MKRYRVLSGIMLMAFGLAACLPRQAEIPRDFSMQLDWNTGALPPRYHYAYSISIDSQGNGKFFYHPGYDENTENDWEVEFSLTAEQMNDLYHYFEDNDILKENWKTGQPLMGGKGTGIKITAGGRQYVIPSISELAENDRKVVNNAVDFIDNLVDQEIWDEMETRQETYEQSYSENR